MKKGFLKITAQVVSTSSMLFLFSCAKPLQLADSSSTAVTADKPSSVISAVDTAVSSLGEGINNNNQSQQSMAVGVVTQQAHDSNCDIHGNPLDSNANQMDQNNPDYPAKVFACKLVKDSGSPDTVRGAYSIIKNIACAMEKSGLVFDGQPHTIQPVLDLSCFTQQQLDDINNGGSPLIATVTASKPAAFNTHYDAGIVIDAQGFGIMRLAVKVDGSKLEFMAAEDQSSISPNKSGAYAATFDQATGDLSFESRFDRFACTESGSCHWSRHDRLAGKLFMLGGQVIGVGSFEGITSEIYDDGNGQYSGRIATLFGSMSDGMKSRLYEANSTTSDDLINSNNYTEVTNNKCYTYSSDSADCSANPGLALPPNTTLAFTLHPSAAATPTQTWAEQLTGLNFSYVYFQDVQ